MTVICPNCDSRFRDPPAGIPIERPLQCSTCEHEWVRNDSRISLDAPGMTPEMADLVGEEKTAIRTNLPVVIDSEPETSVSNAPLFVDKDHPLPIRSKRSYMPLACLAGIGLLAGVVSLQTTVGTHIPQARAVYQAAGLDAGSTQLKIADVNTLSTKKDGIRQLIIRGEIANIAEHEMPIPPIKLTMRGERNVRLYAWTVSAAKDTLKAGEQSRFTAIAHNYPGDAVDVEVEFAPIAKK